MAQNNLKNNNEDLHFRDITNYYELGAGIFLVLIYLCLLILNLLNIKKIMTFSKHT